MDREAIRREVSSFMRFNPSGCCLHIVLDDGNTSRRDVEFCLKYAEENDCQQCLRLGLKLLGLSEAGIEWIYENY